MDYASRGAGPLEQIVITRSKLIGAAAIAASVKIEPSDLTEDIENNEPNTEAHDTDLDYGNFGFGVSKWGCKKK